MRTGVTQASVLSKILSHSERCFERKVSLNVWARRGQVEGSRRFFRAFLSERVRGRERPFIRTAKN